MILRGTEMPFFSNENGFLSRNWYLTFKKWFMFGKMSLKWFSPAEFTPFKFKQSEKLLPEKSVEKYNSTREF